MPASEARLRANRENAKKSTGPRTERGKAASSANALKHGLAAVKVLPRREAEEVERRSLAFCEELDPSGEVGVALARHAARMSVRMERCAEHENASLIGRVEAALADFVPPEGADEAEVARLRHEVERRAQFDASKEATLARRYEAAAERGFFRALKELRAHEKSVKAAEAEALGGMVDDLLGSFGEAEGLAAGPDDRYFSPERVASFRASMATGTGDLAPSRGRVDVPIAIGKRR